uniref:Uncharacterized protein n=1 Tax=Mycena chlorophos TaxID=658473 RepID=A0ABQ0KZS8_MYCCL|nr:predicted protein [Mycena chlorophos]
MLRSIRASSKAPEAADSHTRAFGPKPCASDLGTHPLRLETTNFWIFRGLRGPLSKSTSCMQRPRTPYLRLRRRCQRRKKEAKCSWSGDMPRRLHALPRFDPTTPRRSAANVPRLEPPPAGANHRSFGVRPLHLAHGAPPGPTFGEDRLSCRIKAHPDDLLHFFRPRSSSPAASRDTLSPCENGISHVTHNRPPFPLDAAPQPFGRRGRNLNAYRSASTCTSLWYLASRIAVVDGPLRFRCFGAFGGRGNDWMHVATA